jgi:all-trans-retinol 13,14-reductase
MGGLTAAAALAKYGKRVVVLERHTQLGGLTQTFTRREYTFAVGVHYIGEIVGESGQKSEFGRMLDWLSDGRLHFESLGSPYDIVRLPSYEFPIEAPRALYLERLKSTFPRDSALIDAFFAACDRAKRTARLLFAANGMPAPLGAILRWVNAGRLHRALTVTTADAVRGAHDPRLAATLTARWGDYGIPPARAPLLVHATVLGSYDSGAFYPTGGPAQFATLLAEPIRAAGGELRADTAVSAIRLDGGRAAGVRLSSGEALNARVVISAMGVRNTLAALPEDAARSWRSAVAALKSGLSYVGLYIGLRGDIRNLGATPANVWIYEADDIGKVWEHPLDEEAPNLFVSFPTLKDSSHADSQRHTAEVIAFCRWEPFASWAGSSARHRPEDYEAAKAWIGEALLAQFKRHFPRIAPLIDLHEVSTPLSQAFYVGADQGALYGLEMTVPRLSSKALRTRTPIPGLLLAGQDAAGMGVQGAFMGGFMAAAAVDPRVWRQIT